MQTLSSPSSSPDDMSNSPIIRKGDVRRNLIIETYLQSMAQFGLEESTFERVGKMAGMARTHINYYFKSKNDLTIVAMQHAQYHFEKYWQQAGRHIQTPEQWVDALFAYGKEFPTYTHALGTLSYLASFDIDFRQCMKSLETLIAHPLLPLVMEKNTSKKRDLWPKKIIAVVFSEIYNEVIQGPGQSIRERNENKSECKKIITLLLAGTSSLLH